MMHRLDPQNLRSSSDIYAGRSNNNTFTSSFCTAGSGRQHVTEGTTISAAAVAHHHEIRSGKRSPSKSGVNPPSPDSHHHRISKSSVATVAKSRLDVHFFREEQRAAFVKESADATMMISVSPSDQKIALIILVSEAWRYNTQPRTKAQRQLHGAPLSTTKRTSPTATPRLHSPSKIERASLSATYGCMLNDIRLLMASPLWLPNPEPTVESHPYLFTLDQLSKQKFFSKKN